MTKKVIFVLILIFSSSFITRAVFAWDNLTNHPALTSESVNFYNLYFDKKISEKEKEWMIQGSIDEDTPPRWINHFYDPIYKEGWTGEHGPARVSEELMKKFSDVFLSPENAVSAINWAHNQELQAKYKLYKGNRTWERAIYEYVENDNKKEAFLALGYVLHLVQDMAVPEHTRNDTHPGDSPLENFCTKFTVDNFFISGDLMSEEYEPANFDSLDEYFENLAGYSNNYFFSKDTINDPKYDKPEIIEKRDGFGYGVDKDDEEYLLVKVDTVRSENSNVQISYSLKEDDVYEEILNDYWTRLSRAAVLHSAGVIELFFREVEKAKDDPTRLEAPPQVGSAILSLFGEVTRAKKIFTSAKNWVLALVSSPGVPAGGGIATLADIPKADVSEDVPANQSKPSFGSAPAPEPKPVSEPSSTPEDESIFEPTLESNPIVVEEENPTESEVQPQSFQPFWNSMVPAPAGAGGGGAVGGGGGPSSEVEPPKISEEPQDIISPDAPVIASPSDFSQVFTNDSIIFSGTAEAFSVISQNFSLATTTADLTGNWSLGFLFEQGSTTINFFATDEADNISSSTKVSVFVDSVIPDISFSIPQCEQSLSPDGCLLATTTLSLLWSSTAEDLDFYELALNGQTSTTTATSSVVLAGDNSINNFSIRAKDTAGNWSDFQNISAEISLSPVVINEVAWMGTQQHNNDEWIELYNKTEREISLENWTFYSNTDLKPYINLTGSILPKGYYLIERTDDNAVSDVAADWKGSFGAGSGKGLDNHGENLILSYASTTIDEVPYCYNWCGGANNNANYRFTMERYNPDSAGIDFNNWGTNIDLIKNGRNANGAALGGTPKARNSVNYLINKNQNTLSDLVLTKENSPYLIDRANFIVNKGDTLFIEPGVVIKFYNDAEMSVQGKIISRGTESEPVVFTSFCDDDYGGDLNGDATSTEPEPGNWFGVSVPGSADSGSVFDHTIIRYGGKYYSGVGYSKANLTINDVGVEISNSILEYATAYGLKLINSNSQVKNNIFRYNLTDGSATGILAKGGGEPVIENNDFIENRWGLMIRDSQPVVLSNDFVGNGRDAVNVNGALGVFQNNSGSSNGADIIKVSGSLTKAGLDTVLFSNFLPYVLDNGSKIVASSTLVVQPEIVIKSDYSLTVFGDLIAEGELPDDILFTSSTAEHWAGVRAMPNSFVNLKGTTVRYGGLFTPGFTTAGLYAENAEVVLNNTVFENNRSYGLYLLNSTSTIENSIFRNHLEPGSARAISYHNSPINLKNVSFSNNRLAIYADPNSIVQTVENLTFENNTATTSPEGLF